MESCQLAIKTAGTAAKPRLPDEAPHMCPSWRRVTTVEKSMTSVCQLRYKVPNRYSFSLGSAPTPPKYFCPGTKLEIHPSHHEPTCPIPLTTPGTTLQVCAFFSFLVFPCPYVLPLQSTLPLSPTLPSRHLLPVTSRARFQQHGGQTYSVRRAAHACEYPPALGVAFWRF
jgi:hypothetical protein